jgi:hypothetical protein
MPTAPPAPCRFETTTGCFRNFSSAPASGRPVWSATPPGGKGMIIVTARVGYASCADAEDAISATVTARKAAAVFLIMQGKKQETGRSSPRTILAIGTPPMNILTLIYDRKIKCQEEEKGTYGWAVGSQSPAICSNV